MKRTTLLALTLALLLPLLAFVSEPPATAGTCEDDCYQTALQCQQACQGQGAACRQQCNLDYQACLAGCP